MLILEIANTPQKKVRLPKLKEIEVRFVLRGAEQSSLLVFRLLDPSQRDLFCQLCKDIMHGASLAESELQAVSTAVQRTWRWFHLLRGGSLDRLGAEEQKGLIGELFVLEKYLLPNLSAKDSVLAWQGPLGTAKDFEVGRVCIEAKARKGAGAPFIRINSEHQLDVAGLDALFLFVIELDRTSINTDDGFSLSDVTMRIRNRIESIDFEALEIFEERLLAAGYSWHHDYSSDRWVEGETKLHAVGPEFPSIRASALISGVTNVTYTINLYDCDSFIVKSEHLINHLNGVGNVK